MRFTVKHFKSDEHVIASVFVELSDKTQAQLGTLRMCHATWAAFKSGLDGAYYADTDTTFTFEEK